MGMQNILPITVAVKKIKGADHQYYSDGDGVVQCEKTFSDSYDTFHNFSAKQTTTVKRFLKNLHNLFKRNFTGAGGGATKG